MGNETWQAETFHPPAQPSADGGAAIIAGGVFLLTTDVFAGSKTG